MPNYALLIGLCWLAFLTAWMVLAMKYGSGGRKPSTAAAIGIRFVFLATMFVAIRYGGNPGFQPFGAQAQRVAAAGVAICVAGLAFAVWARVALGRSWGMPMTVHENPELVTNGPYAFVRHPIYTGLGTMFVGTSLVFPLAIVSSALVIVYMVVSALREERDMAARFPDTYPAYQQRSKMLVPFVV